MPQIINTNITSITAQRNLNKSQSDYQTAMERLSSGLRINSAKDDPAGLAISSRITAQTQGLDTAIRNAGDGVSLAQVAGGALGSMSDALLRIRDLALQSANGTNSSVDRKALNQEVQQLKEEIDRISKQTNFNGTKLLDGSFSNTTFQIGANVGETVTVSINGATTDKLGASETDGLTSVANGNALAGGDLVINGIAVPASTGLDDKFSRANADTSAISKAAAINKVSKQTGVTANVNETSISGTSFSNPASTTSGNISINGVDIAVLSDPALSKVANLQNVANSINEKSGQTGVKAVFDNNPDNGIQLVADNGENITLAQGATNGQPPANFGLAAAGTYTGTYTLLSKDHSDITIGTTTGNITDAGLEVGKFSGSNSGAVSAEVGGNALASGDLVINDVAVGPTRASMDNASYANNAASAISKAAAINAVSSKTGVTAVANETIENGGKITAGTATSGNVTINGVNIAVSWTGSDSASDIQNKTIQAINSKSGQTGVEAEALQGGWRLVAKDGRNIDIGAVNNIQSAGFTGLANTEVRSSVALQSAGPIKLSSQTGNIAASGFDVGTYGSSQSGQRIADVDISTVDGANKAINAVDNALSTINLEQANLGAVQNRFQSTIQNQQVASENLTQANSRIKDADFAKETAALSKAKVLQEAGLSILTQANAQPQQVLKLLQ